MRHLDFGSGPMFMIWPVFVDFHQLKGPVASPYVRSSSAVTYKCSVLYRFILCPGVAEQAQKLLFIQSPYRSPLTPQSHQEVFAISFTVN